MRYTIEIDVPRGLESFAEAALPYYQEALQVLVSKQADYGPSNISEMGVPGLVVRLNDKMARLKNLIFTGGKPKHESISDTCIDMTNYPVILRKILDGTWPEDGPRSLAELQRIHATGWHTGEAGPEMMATLEELPFTAEQLLRARNNGVV